MRILQLGLVMAFTALTCGPALACKCGSPSKSPTELADDGWVVVKGVAVSEDISSQPNGNVAYRFKVSHAVNARLRGEITLKSGVHSASCGARLEVGAVSLVRLHRNQSGEYWFASCGQYAIQHDLDGWNAVLDAAE
ncbi:MAG: hypothetical protein OER56_05830 [Hyphomicrobiales bacterium]|nr:hypothetical protein [Hyphomicrobiales bacterium]